MIIMKTLFLVLFQVLALFKKKATYFCFKARFATSDAVLHELTPIKLEEPVEENHK